MFFQYVFRNSGLSRLHSTDLDDMRASLLVEDDDGPDGGCACNKEMKHGFSSKKGSLPVRLSA